MSKGIEPRDERITLRIPAGMKAAIEREAKRERRSMSDMLVILIEDALAKRGKGR